MSTPNKTLTPTLSKICLYGRGEHDCVLSPMVFLTKLISSILLKKNEANKTGLLMNQFSDKVNEARFALRFLVGLNALESLQNQRYLGQPHPVMRHVKLVQNLLSLAYNPLEFLGYLKMIAPKYVDYDGGKYSRAATWCWFFQVILEYINIYYRWLFLLQQEQKLKNDSTVSSSDLEPELAKLRQKKLELLSFLIANLCDTPLAHNWAQKQGYLSAFQIGMLGSVGSVLRLFWDWQYK